MKYQMRKGKRQMPAEDVLAVINRCDVCRIGLFDGEFPYIVPMNFGFETAEDKLVLYFHCAVEGRKLDILRKNPKVCFEMDTAHELTIGPMPCDYSMNYECVMGEGTIAIVEDRAEKLHALERLALHYGKQGPYEWREEVLAITCVLRLTADFVSGKRLRR